jgi:hypothetical protein
MFASGATISAGTGKAACARPPAVAAAVTG